MSNLFCPKCKISLKYDKSRTCLRCQTSSLPFQCNTCKRLYKHVRNLQRHQTHVCDKEPAFTCHQCGEKFHLKENLTCHIKCKHMECEEVRCRKCKAVLKNKVSYRGHMRYCGKGKLKCKHCSFETGYNGTLQKHIRTKHITKLRCKSCYETFRTENLLIVHERTCIQV